MGSGGRPRLGCSRPPSCARDGAGRRAPPLPPAMQAPLHTDGSHENTRPTEGQGNNTRTGLRLRPPPPLVTRDSGLRDPQPRAQSERGRRVAAAPSQAGAVRRGGSKSAEQGAADAPTAQPQAGTPELAPQAGTPSGHPRIPCGGGRAPSSLRCSAREGLESM